MEVFMKIQLISASVFLALAFATFGSSVSADELHGVIKSTYGGDIGTGTGTCLRSEWSSEDTRCITVNRTPNKFYNEEEEGPIGNPGFGG